MRTRLRLGAATAVGLGALLLATALASPAFAWKSTVTVNARCLDDGSVRVHYRVESSEKGAEAIVLLSYELDGAGGDLPASYFGPGHNVVRGHKDFEAGTEGTITVTAKVLWKNGEKSTDHGSDTLPSAEKCASKVTTTTSDSEVTTTTSGEEETTTTVEVGGATSTTEGEDVLGTTTTTGGQLPFTGASSVPMLLAGLGLVGGGLLFLWSSRTRGRHAAR